MGDCNEHDLEEALRGILQRVITEASLIYSSEEVVVLQSSLKNYSTNMELSQLIDTSLRDLLQKVKIMLAVETESEYSRLERQLQKVEEENRKFFKNLDIWKTTCVELQEEVTELQALVSELRTSNFNLSQQIKKQADSLEAEIEGIRKSLPKKAKMKGRKQSPDLHMLLNLSLLKKPTFRKTTCRESSTQVSSRTRSKRLHSNS